MSHLTLPTPRYADNPELFRRLAIGIPEEDVFFVAVSQANSELAEELLSRLPQGMEVISDEEVFGIRMMLTDSQTSVIFTVTHPVINAQQLLSLGWGILALPTLDTQFELNFDFSHELTDVEAMLHLLTEQ